jgi:phosphatidate cytidylyltransferase
MLRTRLWMGAILVLLTAGVLVADRHLAPWYPFLLVLVLALASVACFEMHGLLAGPLQPPLWLCYTSVIALVAANWAPRFFAPESDAWHWLLSTFAAVVIVAFLAEMAAFRGPGESVPRVALTVWIAAYLGLLPAFFVQLRWLESAPGDAGIDRGTLALALAAFVPKCADIGAYFTGRLLGRHRMAPVLSPKKTWEGAVGGVAASIAAAIGINRLGPVLQHGIWAEVGFGLTVGVTGILGDLAESLIKRDRGQKDASLAVPGFGGVLDVIDSIIFAAPVAYCWLASK